MTEKCDVHVVDEIFPAYEVHLFVGPSGAGKTTYLFQFIKAWSAGEKIFGYQSHPQPYVYISCDRSKRNIQRTFKRIGLPAEQIPTISVIDEPVSRDIMSILKFARDRYPEAKVLFIEGLASLVPGGRLIDYKVVSDFLVALAQYCNLNEVTIFGVGHSTKTKKGEEYLNPRERVIGSVAWAGFSETIFFFEPLEPDNPECALRRLHVLPRNAKQQTFDFDFSSGLLVPIAKVEKEKEPPTHRINLFLSAIPAGGEFDVSELRDFVGKVHKSYLFRMLAEFQDRGLVKRIGVGRYRHTPPEQAPFA